MENNDPVNPLPADVFRTAEVHYEDLPVSEISASGQGVPSALFAPPEIVSGWDDLERTFGEFSRHIKEQVAASGPEFFYQLKNTLLRDFAYEPSYVGGQLDRKNLRMYEWQRGELYIHSAALILDPETTLEVTYEPEGRVKRLLLESDHRRITYLGEIPAGVSREEGNAVAVWRTQRGKDAVAANTAEFLDDLSDIYIDSLREALATRRRFIEDYGVEPHRIRLSYDDQPYEVNYANTKFRRAHIHALPVIRSSPLDARENIASSIRGTGERGTRREARARALVNRIMPAGETDTVSASPAKYALLWVRDNRDQAAFMDTKPEILKQSIEVLRATDPDRKIFLVGDDLFKGRPELLSAFREEGVLEDVDADTLIRFWAAEKNGGTALSNGEQALFLHYLNTDADVVQVGIESGALESAICLGIPTVYFQAREHVGDKGTRWQLYWASWSFGESRVSEEPDGSKKFFASGRPVKRFDRSGDVYPPPLMTARRVEFGPDLPDPADTEAEPITVYYPGNITVGIDQISTLVESSGLIGMVRAFDPEWSEEAWSASQYYAEQIHKWTLVETNDWETASRRYEAITHSLNGMVHPADSEVRRGYESAGYHLDGRHDREDHQRAASTVFSAAYSAAPQDRGTAVTAALREVLTDDGFKARCVQDLRLVALSAEEQAKFASSVVEVTAANKVLRTIGNIAPDGSPTTSKHVAEALSTLLPQQRAQARQISTADGHTEKVPEADSQSARSELNPAVRSADPALRPENWAAYNDADLAALQERSQRAAAGFVERARELHQRHVALRTAYEEQDGGAMVAHLRAQGAAPETIERARAATAQDIAYTQRRAAEAQTTGEATAAQARTINLELQRRAGLSPQQLQAEESARQHLIAQRAVPPPGVSRRPGPQQQTPGRGQSL
ncbi:hypothetical protein OHU11_41805 (plasmid) [Streptomyces sp. NBC_00257]|uniref:hypothetical protein n=1 Tax=unclassified Streptomyces TaxID=2593676 RepID=UPI00224F6640|nr:MULTISPECIES: hypothetical protein [unclassified Streptomyces]MCX5434717.1 hypothetical protein [Streptomyces sp. NBC_00062]